MKPEDMPPLPDDLRTLVGAERKRTWDDADVKTRLRARIAIAASVATAGAATGAIVGRGAIAQAAPGLRGLWAAMPASRLATVLVSLAAGGVAGAVGHAALTSAATPRLGTPAASASASSIDDTSSAPRAVPTVVPSQLPLVPAASASALASGSARGVAASSASGAAASASSSATAAGSAGAERVDAERSLVDRAQAAASRGRWDAAREALLEHERTFAHGRLAEEGEALWIQVLAGSGDVPVATERATRFRSRWPESLYIPAIDRALKPR